VRIRVFLQQGRMADRRVARTRLNRACTHSNSLRPGQAHPPIGGMSPVKTGISRGRGPRITVPVRGARTAAPPAATCGRSAEPPHGSAPQFPKINHSVEIALLQDGLIGSVDVYQHGWSYLTKSIIAILVIVTMTPGRLPANGPERLAVEPLFTVFATEPGVRRAGRCRSPPHRRCRGYRPQRWWGGRTRPRPPAPCNRPAR
jgi:hypothetical protein